MATANYFMLDNKEVVIKVRTMLFFCLASYILLHCVMCVFTICFRYARARDRIKALKYIRHAKSELNVIGCNKNIL